MPHPDDPQPCWGFRLGARHIYGGSVATIVTVGTVHRAGVPVPRVRLSCPDFSDRLITLVGNDTYHIGPESEEG